MPSRKVFRLLKHAADVHKPSVGARAGYPHVSVPRPPPESSSALPQKMHHDSDSSPAFEKKSLNSHTSTYQIDIACQFNPTLPLQQQLTLLLPGA